jgi:hypothetical protein
VKARTTRTFHVSMHWTSVFCALAARHIKTCSFREVRSNANEASTCKVGADQLSMNIKPRLHFEMLIAACYDSHNPPKPLARFVSVQCLNALEYFLHSLATRFVDLTSDDDSTAPGNAPAPVTLFVKLLYKSGRPRCTRVEIVQPRT